LNPERKGSRRDTLLCSPKRCWRVQDLQKILSQVEQSEPYRALLCSIQRDVPVTARFGKERGTCKKTGGEKSTVRITEGQN